MQAITVTAVACACCLALPWQAGNGCKVKSGTATAALAEVFVGNSCPGGYWNQGHDWFGGS